MSRYATSTWPGGMQPHLLDSTMFWSAAGGGVRRYLLTKRAWLARENGWQHSIVAPGVRGPGFVDCGGWPLPPAHCAASASRLLCQNATAGTPRRCAESSAAHAGRYGSPASIRSGRHATIRRASALRSSGSR